MTVSERAELMLSAQWWNCELTRTSKDQRRTKGLTNFHQGYKTGYLCPHFWKMPCCSRFTDRRFGDFALDFIPEENVISRILSPYI